MACKSCKCKSPKLGPLPPDTVEAYLRMREQEERIEEALERSLRKFKQQLKERKKATKKKK